MLNTLANHHFLPHHGRNLTRPQVTAALFDALHVNHTLSSFLFDFGLLTSPHGPNATTWSLDDLGVHNVLEHDGSLSRSDAYFGSPLAFNQSVFDETKGYWGPGGEVDVAMAAEARAGRIRESRRTNPEFGLSELGREFAFGESVAYVVFLGGKRGRESGVANRSWVEWFFGEFSVLFLFLDVFLGRMLINCGAEHEELPRHFGWTRPETLFQAEDLDKWMDAIRNKTAPDPDGNPVAARSDKRAASHWGF